MSKVKHKSISEEELRKFYDSLPEASKTYLDENLEHMSHETFKAYFTGFMHAWEQAVEIVNEYLRGVEEILHK
jgi:hypothetical protein